MLRSCVGFCGRMGVAAEVCGMLQWYGGAGECQRCSKAVEGAVGATVEGVTVEV